MYILSPLEIKAQLAEIESPGLVAGFLPTEPLEGLEFANLPYYLLFACNPDVMPCNSEGSINNLVDSQRISSAMSQTHTEGSGFNKLTKEQYL